MAKSNKKVNPLAIDRDDDWGAKTHEWLQQQNEAWQELMNYTGVLATKKKMPAEEEMMPYIEAVGEEHFKQQTAIWLKEVMALQQPRVNNAIGGNNPAIVRSLLWLCVPVVDHELLDIVRAFLSYAANNHWVGMGSYFKDIGKAIVAMDARLKVESNKGVYLLEEYDLDAMDNNDMTDDEFDDYDPFAQAVNKFMKGAPAADQQAWTSLWQLAAKKGILSTTATPHPLVDKVGTKIFLQQLEQWTKIAAKAKPIIIDGLSATMGVMLEENTKLLQNLFILSVPVMDKKLAEAIGALVAHCSKQSAHRAFVNGCLKILAATAQPEGLAQLMKIRKSIKQSSTKELIDQLLQNSAAARGISKDEQADNAVPEL